MPVFKTSLTQSLNAFFPYHFSLQHCLLAIPSYNGTLLQVINILFLLFFISCTIILQTGTHQFTPCIQLIILIHYTILYYLQTQARPTMLLASV